MLLLSLEGHWLGRCLVILGRAVTFRGRVLVGTKSKAGRERGRMTVRKKEKERKGTGLAHSAENSGLISPWRVVVKNVQVNQLRSWTVKLCVYL